MRGSVGSCPHLSFLFSKHLHCVSKKGCHFYLCNNFGKRRPILIIVLLFNSQIYCWRSWDQNDHLTLSLLPHYLAKLECATYNVPFILTKIDRSASELISAYDNKLTNGFCFVDFFLYLFIISACCWRHYDVIVNGLWSPPKRWRQHPPEASISSLPLTSPITPLPSPVPSFPLPYHSPFFPLTFLSSPLPPLRSRSP